MESGIDLKSLSPQQLLEWRRIVHRLYFRCSKAEAVEKAKKSYFKDVVRSRSKAKKKYQLNRDAILKSNKTPRVRASKTKYRENNREKLRQASRLYLEANRDEVNARCRKWRAMNPEKTKQQYLHWKDRAYAGYGGYKCNCCGVKEKSFLTIDHINNDGALRRKEEHGAGRKFYRWLVINGHPEDFQILCFNCQWGKRLLGICPHQTRKRKRRS